MWDKNYLGEKQWDNMVQNLTSPIYKFWIIHQPSGICIFEQTFNELPTEIDPDLTAGYLFAITTLSQEIAQENIRFLQLENLRFVYGISQHFIMVILSQNELHQQECREKLKELQNVFDAKYHRLVTDSQMFEVSKFQDFARIVESSLQTESKYFQILERRTGELDDFFKNATEEWNSIQKSIIDRSKKLGSWIHHEKTKLSHHVERSLLKTRLKEEKRETESQQTPEQNKSKWV